MTKPVKDQPSDCSPSAIVKALEEQQCHRKGAEARKFPRQFLCVPAVLEIRDHATAPARHASVATNNISEGGFGFIFDAHLKPGTLVRVCFESLPGKPCIKGLVRSSVRICGTQHRVGVEFNQIA